MTFILTCSHMIAHTRTHTQIHTQTHTHTHTHLFPSFIDSLSSIKASLFTHVQVYEFKKLKSFLIIIFRIVFIWYKNSHWAAVAHQNLFGNMSHLRTTGTKVIKEWKTNKIKHFFSLLFPIYTSFFQAIGIQCISILQNVYRSFGCQCRGLPLLHRIQTCFPTMHACKSA